MPTFTNGTFGRFGTLGSLGTSGTLGNNVTDDTEGTEGSQGTSGTVGTAGTIGTGGTAGSGGALPGPPTIAALKPSLPQQGSNSRSFVAARVPGPKVVVYVADDGSEVIREGGSRAWRNQNPGNIQKGSFADANGAIGGDSRFAIFPDERTGREAIVTLLRGPSYRSLTLEAAINRYAPPHENSTDKYVSFVSDDTGISSDAIIKNLPIAKVRQIANTIKKIEGWKPGTERENTSFSMGSGGPSTPIVSAAGAAADWMNVAIGEANLPASDRTEWPDPGENPRILRYFEIASPWFDPEAGDEVDWCAAFVNYCLETAGFPGTGHPGARSFFWNKHQNLIKLDDPTYGSIAVFRKAPFSDPKWATGAGHVAFVTSWTEQTVTCLGGNQGKTVQSKTYQKVQKNSSGKITRRLVAFMAPVMN